MNRSYEKIEMSIFFEYNIDKKKKQSYNVHIKSKIGADEHDKI